jgi:hypothetical protein
MSVAGITNMAGDGETQGESVLRGRNIIIVGFVLFFLIFINFIFYCAAAPKHSHLDLTHATGCKLPILR